MRTRATLRSAEFGFLGVVVYTRVQTPRRCGAATFFLRPFPDFKPGVASFFVFGLRPLRTSWDVVGIRRRRVAALKERLWGTRASRPPARPRTSRSSRAGLAPDGLRRAESRAIPRLRRSAGSRARPGAVVVLPAPLEPSSPKPPAL